MADSWALLSCHKNWQPFKNENGLLSFPLKDRALKEIHELLLHELSEHLAGEEKVTVGLAREFGKARSKYDLWNLTKEFFGFEPDPIPLAGQMKIRIQASIEETAPGTGEFACVDILLDEVAGTLSVTFEARAYRNDIPSPIRTEGSERSQYKGELVGSPLLKPEALGRANSIWMVVWSKVKDTLREELGPKSEPPAGHFRR